MTNRLVAGRYRIGNEVTSPVNQTEWSACDEWSDDRDVILTPVAIQDLDEATSTYVHQRIAGEVGLLSRLENPALVRALDVVVEAGRLWVVREPGPARSIGDVAWDQAVEFGTLVGYARDAAAALDAAHGAGLVHRNLTPRAIRVPEDGPAVLAGLATTVLGRHFAVPTAPAFPAPELATDPLTTPATDVFALGVTVQQLLGDPRHLPPGIVELLYAMTAPTPDRRPSAAVVAQRFAAFADPAGAAVSAGSGPEPAGVGAAPEAAGVAPYQETVVVPHPYPTRPPPYPMPATHPASAHPAPGHRGRRRGVLVAAVAGTAALIVAAALLAPAGLSWVREPGAPPPAPAGPPTPFGDPATADPCSLLDAQNFVQYGQPQLTRDLLHAAGCTVEISTTGGGFAAVSTTFGGPSAYAPEGTPEQSGELTIYREQPTATFCRRTIVLRDGHRVFVDTRSTRNPTPSPCVLGDVAMTEAAAVIASGTIDRRPGTSPPNALTRIDVCDLLDATALGLVPNLNDRRQEGFASWSCVWGGDPAFPALPHVSASINRYRSLDGVPSQIAGRSVLTTPGDAMSASCQFTISHRAFAGDIGGQLVEILSMSVYLGTGESPEEACRVGGELVAALAPKLPAP